MSENWKYQLSIKINAHMLNLRADTGEEFLNMLKEATETYAEPIDLACERLGGAVTPQVSTPAPPTRDWMPKRPKATSGFGGPRGTAIPMGEFGPVQIVAAWTEDVNAKGVPFAGGGVKQVVKFSDEKTYSTFQGHIGQAAKTLQGQNVFYSLEKRGEYTNLAGIRRAG